MIVKIYRTHIRYDKTIKTHTRTHAVIVRLCGKYAFAAKIFKIDID